MSYDHTRSSSSPSPVPDIPPFLDPPSRTRYRTITTSSSASSLAASFAQQSTSKPHTHNGYGHHLSRSRGFSPTPSSTSLSDDDIEDMEFDPSRMVAWAKKKGTDGDVKGKGKASGNKTVEGLAGSLPPEILIHIFRLLSSNRDLLSVLQVSRNWCLCGYPILWYKPTFTSPRQLSHFTRILRSPNTLLPYPASVRRLHLTNLASDLNDHLISGLELCTRIIKLSIGGAEGLSTQAIKKMVAGMPELSSVDFNAMGGVEDQVVITLAECCEKLQGLNIGGCKGVGDAGLKAIAKRNMFRRLKVGECHRLTDQSMVAVAQSCALLLELDLSQVPQITNATLFAIFLHLSHLRELRICGNSNFTEDGIPNLTNLIEQIADDPEPDIESIPWYAKINGIRSIPASPTFEHLKLVDFTGCSSLTDLAIDNLVTNAPKIRTLTLAKCTGLTGAAVESISKLGRYLHYIHLGHVAQLTDAAVTKLARSCTRIRYIDVACCPNLTDLSVFELAANLTKVRRIGLVKATKITDEGIFALVERHATLERLHLSYCENISVKAVTLLLNRLLRLTHLSLTGVSAFKVPELQQFCRPTPPEFSEHQRESFCVYSGHGITSLRNYLNAQIAATTATSDDGSTRRGSGSSTSSITIPGGYSPPSFRNLRLEPSGQFPTSGTSSREGSRRASHDDRMRNGPSHHVSHGQHNLSSPTHQQGSNGESRSTSTSGRRSIHAPVFRFAQRPASPFVSENNVPGLPGAMFTSTAPNFFAPEGVGIQQRPTRSSLSGPSGALSAPPGVPVPGPQGLVGYPMEGDNRERARPRGPRSGAAGGASAPYQPERGEDWSGRGGATEYGEDGGGAGRSSGDGGGGSEASGGPLRWMASTFGWNDQQPPGARR